jgi:signal transduction histidine kinase
VRTRPRRLQRLLRAAEPTPWPDVGLAVALAVAAVWWVLADGAREPSPVPFDDSGPGAVSAEDSQVPLDIAVNLLITGLVAVRRRLPVVVLVGQLAAIVTLDFFVTPACLAAVLVGAYSLAVHGRTTRMAAGVLIGVSTAVALAELDSWLRLPGWAGVFALLLPGGLAGLAVRSARARARASEERTTALHREQEAVAELAVAQERARIARELHDVVSHHVSMMTIQAGAAGAVLDSDPGRARTALSAIEASGRETMTELRHLLGVLAASDNGAEDTQPQPGLQQLEALVRRVQQTGQPVTVQRQDGLAVPHGAGLTAYRVVQEALTNTLRYAPGAATQVVVRAEPPSSLVVEVLNDEPRPGASAAHSAAHSAGRSGSRSGLLGLSERLRLYGGTLEARPRLGGGFRVRALIPLADNTATATAGTTATTDTATGAVPGTDGAP